MKRIDWKTLDTAARDATLARPAQARAPGLRQGVEGIIAQVRARGDAALLELTARYDGVAVDDLAVSEQEFADAEARLPEALKAAILEAAGRIETFHRAAAPVPVAIDTAPGVRVERVLRPVRRVGLYVPAGGAPLPSTAIMLGVPAAIAGCPEVLLCTPVQANGRCD
ncbi:MAG: histidinol dehydrogenase, partial [Luteibacter jiangsuensis]